MNRDDAELPENDAPPAMVEAVEAELVATASGDDEPPPGLRADLAVLMKVRLNFFVLITAFFGFVLATRGDWQGQWMLMAHTLFGTALAAFGSAAFNQLMEVDLDARMRRTADRPLPSRRMSPMAAFGIGWVLTAVGIIHLAAKVGHLAAYLTAATIAIYVFIYTPLKRMSTTNTLVGAVPGAIPPVIGWVGAGGALGWEALFLFAVLFFWQLPHFIAINWLCREEYEDAGYRMWSNGDVSGRKSGLLAAGFSLVLALVSLLPAWIGFASVIWSVVGPLLAFLMMGLSLKFAFGGSRDAARRLFLFTLLYLPVALLVLVVAWRPL